MSNPPPTLSKGDAVREVWVWPVNAIEDSRRWTIGTGGRNTSNWRGQISQFWRLSFRRKRRPRGSIVSGLLGEIKRKTPPVEIVCQRREIIRPLTVSVPILVGFSGRTRKSTQRPDWLDSVPVGRRGGRTRCPPIP